MAGSFQSADGPAQIIASFLSFRIRCGVRLQKFFRALPLRLSPLDIDIFRALGNFCQHDHAVRENFSKTPMDGHVMLFAVLPVLQCSSLKFRQKRGVTGKDPEIAFFARDGDLIHFPFGNLTVRSDNLQLDTCG